MARGCGEGEGRSGRSAEAVDMGRGGGGRDVSPGLVGLYFSGALKCGDESNHSL